jgi:hypothetical protein
MSPGTGENNFSFRKAVKQEQITFYMTFGNAFIITGKLVFPVFFRQGFFPNNQRHDFNYFVNVFVPPLHKAKVFYKLAGEFRNKHCLALQGLFQACFQFFPGPAPGGVYENGAGDFPPCYGFGLPQGGQGYGIGGMFRGAFWGKFDVFHCFYGVHTRLLTLNYTPFWEERQLFRLFLPGTAPLGYFPNRFKGRIWVDNLPGNGFYTQGTESLIDRPFRYSEFFGQFLYCKSFHNQSISKIFKKVKIFLSKVVDKHKIFLYDVIRGDKNMAKKLLEAWEVEERDARVAGIGREFYQLMEDYPFPGDWSYMDYFMFIHQRIYDEAIKLKKAAVAADRSGGALRREAS